MRPHRRMMDGRAILSRAVIQVEDALEDPEYAQDVARAGGFRSMLAVPMMREGNPIGAIVVNRGQPGSFSVNQIDLLKTFADQAVIAVENVRLFKELDARNRDLSETLEQQTATGEILRVISSSPTDVQPVFDIIGESAEKLCDAAISVVSRFDGDLIHMVSLHGVAPEGIKAIRDAFPMRVDDETVSARAVRTRAVVHVSDVLADPQYQQKGAARASGYRGCLAVPMVRENQVIGAIFVARTTPGLFTDTQVELLKTFADQAVIAVENVRLFRELQARNNDLTADAGAADGDGRDPARDLGLAHRRAAGLRHDRTERPASLRRRVLPGLPSGSRSAPQRGQRWPGRGGPRRASAAPSPAQSTRGPQRDARSSAGSWRRSPTSRPTLRSRWARSRAPSPSAASWPSPSCARAFPSARSPSHARRPALFPDRQVQLLKLFADQAVIAIENVRLFAELEARNHDLTETLEQQTATSEILRVISSSPTDVQPVFDTIAESAAAAVRRVRGHGPSFRRRYAPRRDGARARPRADVTRVGRLLPLPPWPRSGNRSSGP